MKGAICLSRPFEVFIDSEIIEREGFTDDIAVEISLGEDTREIAVPFYSIEEFDLHEEDIATFESLANISGDLPAEITELFDSNCLNDEGDSIEINGPDAMESYIKNVGELNNRRLEGQDVILGIGIFDNIVKEPREKMFEGNFSAASTKFILDALSIGPHDIEVDKCEMEVEEPDELIFCTHTHALTEDVYEDIREYLADIEYLTSFFNYLVPSPAGTFHGPLPKYEVDESSLMKMSEENIKFNSIKWATMTAEDNDIILDLDDIYEAIKENIEYEGIKRTEDHERVIIEFGTYSAELTNNDTNIQIHVSHATEENVDEFKSKIDDLISILESRIECAISRSTVHTHTYQSPLLNDIWVLDTNTLYKQSPHPDSTDISDFILSTKNIYIIQRYKYLGR